MNPLIGHVLRFWTEWQVICSGLFAGGSWRFDGVIQPEKLLVDLVNHPETVNHYVKTSQHCRYHAFNAGVHGHAYLREGGKTRPRWHGPAALGADHRAVLDRRIEIRRL